MAPDTSALHPDSSSDPYIGQIIEAKIVDSNRDIVNVSWQAEDLPKARGRLLQEDSWEFESQHMLEDIPAYRPGNSVKIYVRHRRKDGLYFVHERWAEFNPWDSLDLQVGDLVVGTVSHRVENATGLVGYLVHLDESPFPEDVEEKREEQPDIEVLVRVRELPWADGSIASRPKGEDKRALSLQLGEKLLLTIKSIETPPEHPIASLLTTIAQRDISLERHWRERQSADISSFLLIPEDSPTSNRESTSSLAQALNQASAVIQQVAESKEEVTDPDTMLTRPSGTLAGVNIWIVDDSREKLNALSVQLKVNGAQVHLFQVRYSLWANDMAKEASAILGKALHAAQSDAAPDLLMVDFNLSHPGVGLQLVRLLHERLHEYDFAWPRIALMSNLMYELESDQRVGLVGTLARPISLAVISELLRDQQVWQHSKRGNAEIAGVSAQSLQQWLDLFRDELQAEFVVALGVSSNANVLWWGSSGRPPFAKRSMQKVKRDSELRLLSSGKLDKFEASRDRDNSSLLLGSCSYSYWLSWSRIGESEPSGIVGWGSDRQFEDKELAWIRRSAREASARIGIEQVLRLHAPELGNQLQEVAVAHEFLANLEKLSESERTISMALESLRDGKIDADQLQVHLRELQVPNGAVAEFKELTENLLLERRRSVHKPLDLQSACQWVQDWAKRRCDQAEVRLLWPERIPQIKLALPTSALTSPLMNLVDNAAKHHQRQENRLIAVSFDCPRSGPRAHCLRVRVEDNGFGIPESVRKRLFQAYFSSAKVAKRHGVGLWLAQRLARQQGGGVELVWNYRGLGCTFELWLPLRLENFNDDYE